MEARLLYRDGLMLVLDKPAGLPVHRGPKAAGMKNVLALEDHFDALRFGLPRVPGLAHRLDRETSGCLVLGRHRKALETLGKLFKDSKIGKTYWALVEGGPEEDEGTIDLPLGRRDETRGWWMKVDPAGQPAVTRWTVMGRSSSFTSPKPKSDVSDFGQLTLPNSGTPEFGSGEVDRQSAAEAIGRGVNANTRSSDCPPPQPSPARGEGADRASGDVGAKQCTFTWLALEPVTGRTHQLRVHCQAKGWPIVGDGIYGTAPRFDGPGLHLLARKIVVPLYKNRDPIRVTAPVPPHMRERLTACGWKEDQPLTNQGSPDGAKRHPGP